MTEAQPEPYYMGPPRAAVEFLDVEEIPTVVANVKEMLDSGIPAFGIGLGHLVIAAAAGLPVFKMKKGHHGANQPAKDLVSGRTYVTSQNHCYVVTDPGCGTVRFVNANDATCEGIDYPALRAFTVQFAPDTTGDKDSAFLYNRFVEVMKGGAL